MPDNQSVEIYRKGHPGPIRMTVRSVEELSVSGIPKRFKVTTEDGREGTIYLNASEIDAVVVTPAGDPNR